MRINHAYLQSEQLILELDTKSLLVPSQMQFNLSSASSIVMLHIRTGVPYSIWDETTDRADALWNFIGKSVRPMTPEMFTLSVAIKEHERYADLRDVSWHLGRWYQEHPHG